MCDTLEKVERGELDRVMFFLPPRHSKSMTISEGFPSWFIGKKPERRVIEVSYGASLAEKFGSKNRNHVEEYGEQLFNIKLSKASKSKTDWEIEGHRGGMISAGIGGGITGEGADLLIIDDVVKNRAEAESITYRDMVYNEWINTLLTRLSPTGRVIIIMTRWHGDDLAGRLLRDEGRVESGGKWTVIELPAFAVEPYTGKDDSETIYPDALGREVGAPLWPDFGFTTEWLEKQKASVGTYTWESLYQQRPRPRDAVRMFRKEWFTIVNDWPRDAKTVRYWDMAATEAARGKDADWTAGVKMCEKGGQYWVIDVVHEQLAPLGVERKIKQTAEMDGRGVVVHIEQEGGSAGVTVADHYRREVLKGFSMIAERPTGSKDVRALPFSAAAEAGNVFVVRGKWNADYLEELDNFLIMGHDDQVDGSTGACNALSKGFKPFTLTV